MAKRNTLVALLYLLLVHVAVGQKAVYTTTGGEWIFSSADVKINGANANSIIRFSPVFNFQTQVHRDFSNKIGLMTGIGFRNVGFIYDDPFNTKTRYKARTYNIGIPIALKFGDMNGMYFFAGYELEIPINYKEKKFVNEDKVDVSNYWFNGRVPAVYNTLFAGVQLPEGLQLKFKYYVTNFYNKTYQAVDGSGNLYQPYNFDVNVFYVSISFQILKGTTFVYKKV
jgi:hypothetical protein